MTDDQPRMQRHIEQLKSLGLSDAKAKELIESESPFYNDLIIIDKLKSLSDEQEKLAKHSNWQNWAIIGGTVVIIILTAATLAVALHWP